jgi:Domain of unknown function (DU1801)
MSITTPDDYVAAQPEDRAAMLRALRAVILANLPSGYAETINWGMICYEIPLATVPRTYNGKPLMYAALGNKKAYIALHLCGLYTLPGRLGHFTGMLAQPGKTLHVGKACIEVKRLDSINLDVVGAVIASTSVEEFAAASRR